MRLHRTILLLTLASAGIVATHSDTSSFLSLRTVEVGRNENTTLTSGNNPDIGPAKQEHSTNTVEKCEGQDCCYYYSYPCGAKGCKCSDGANLRLSLGGALVISGMLVGGLAAVM